MAKTHDIQKSIVSDLVKTMKSGVKPWNNPFIFTLKPQIRLTKERYQGINALLLLLVAAERKYNNPVWMTFKQAAKSGYKVKKGEKATPIFFYKSYEKHEPDSPYADEDGKVQAKAIRYYYVFNAEQIEGFEDDKAPQPDLSDIEKACDMLKDLVSIGANIVIEPYEAAHYNIPSDTIHISSPHLMTSPMEFVATLAHELIHRTGHQSRLARFDKTIKSKQAYATEEIITELAAVMFCAQYGIAATHIDNHAAYLNTYIEMLNEKPSALFSFAAQSEKALSYLEGEIKGQNTLKNDTLKMAA